MKQKTTGIRVRFAPSPTGDLHIGGLRSALFNWLFAKHNGGVFLLRIEDTDRERSLQQYTDSIIESLVWVGLTADEPLVVQSTRIDEHVRQAHELVLMGKAYRCICSQEEVLQRYVQAGGAQEQVKYDGRCRTAKIPVDTNVPSVIRFKIPDDIESIIFDDIICGTITIPRDQLDDFIIVRSDGTPMYNFVVVVDDAFMQISHVIRGQEHIINTPKQIMLYQAFGYTVPTFAHIPLVLGPSGQKLSKREAATSVTAYKKAGFLPEALISYLARLGWAHGDQEIFTLQELINYFDLAQVNKAGAIFDVEKLLWLNGVYMRALPDEKLSACMQDQYGSCAQNVLPLIALYKDRVRTLKELHEQIMITVDGPAEFQESDLQPLCIQEAVTRTKNLVECLENMSEWNSDSITSKLKVYAQNMGAKFADVVHPFRIALIGKGSGPGVGALAVFLGKNECVRRVTKLYDTIERMCDTGL